MKHFIKYNAIILYDDGPLIPLEEGFEFLDCVHNYDNFRHRHGREIAIFHNKSCYKQSVSNRLFFKQPYCSCCGLQAQGWKLICSPDPIQLAKDIWTLNLFAMINGELIQFTRDHIIPRSKGGDSKLSNLQTMCIDCNRLKRNTEDYAFKMKYGIFMKERQFYQPELQF